MRTTFIILAILGLAGLATFLTLYIKAKNKTQSTGRTAEGNDEQFLELARKQFPKAGTKGYWKNGVWYSTNL